jgi:hypothetical protein
MSFPRKEGKCKLFKIPNEVFTTESDNCYISDLALAKGLEYLQNEDLVFGDLVEYEFVYSKLHIIYKDKGLVIYDGEKLVNLYSNLGEWGSLHMIFQVIKNNVPLDYWDAIDYNYVWFDVSPVYQELLDNITQEGEIVFSHFYYDGKKYFIKMTGEYGTLEEFEKCLSEGPILPFIYTNDEGDFSPDTLYMYPFAVKEWLNNLLNYPEDELYKIEKFHKKANFLFENYFFK